MTINYLFISVSEHFLMKSESMMSASSFDFALFSSFCFLLYSPHFRGKKRSSSLY
jgi:hypothetical protein